MQFPDCGSSSPGSNWEAIAATIKCPKRSLGALRHDEPRYSG